MVLEGLLSNSIRNDLNNGCPTKNVMRGLFVRFFVLMRSLS